MKSVTLKSLIASSYVTRAVRTCQVSAYIRTIHTIHRKGAYCVYIISIFCVWADAGNMCYVLFLCYVTRM